MFNDQGAFDAVARVSEGMVPDAVIAPYGYWKAHVSGGSTVAGVTSAEQTDIGRAPSTPTSPSTCARCGPDVPAAVP